YGAVIFEASGVLLPAPHRTAADWEAQDCLPAGTVQRALLSGEENSPSLKYTRGELTPVEFLRELGQQCFDIANVCVPVDSFLADAIRNELTKQLPVMAAAARRIRAEGLRTALLNYSSCLRDGGTFVPLDQQHFDLVIESCREGLLEPDPRVYRLCLERLGAEPQESILLDSSSQNLNAAAQLGIHPLKVDDLEAALKELEAHLGFPLQGFVPHTRSVRPSVEIPRDRLHEYLRSLLGHRAAAPLELRQLGHGRPTCTYLIRFGDRSLVLKKEPSGRPRPSGPAVRREYRVLKALAEAGVPVPTALALCEDTSTLGTPFYLMEHCAGRIHSHGSLAALPPGQRRAVYAAMSQVLSKIHSVDLRAAQLEDFGEHGDYVQRQVETWTKQYRAVETHVIPAMERLIEWLPLHLPKSQKTTLVHGDFRVDKLVFHPDRPEVLAVLGWKLSTRGDPVCDVASSCTALFLPPGSSVLRGLRKCDVGSPGVPTAEEYSQMYCGHAGAEHPDNWNFYMAAAFFQLAVKLQGLCQRSLAEKPTPGKSSPEDAEFVANLAWDFAIREGFRVFNSLPTTKLLARPYSTWAG
ncbi:ACD10 dehydrogenase, partial [Rhinopomastus cyanomelas]|nr:ACD10 dehydrogenase [Rhinopomastus cyanomelas]